MIRHVAIVGAGFSGTLLAINLLRHDGPRATLIERALEPGRGVAYSTAHSDHVLNVRAANMSAFPDQPDHFVRWLATRGIADAAAAFVPRTVYGDYLRTLLAAAEARAVERLTIVTGDAIDLGGEGDELRLSLADGTRIAADAAVIAVGNLPPDVPPALAALARSPRFFADPWNPAVADGLCDDDTVLLVGSGLTMVDVALLLDARGFRGRMIAISRRGLLPQRHASVAPNASPRSERPREPLSVLVRAMRARGAAIGWRNAVDEMRPFTQATWGQASRAERARFLRHLRPWWDVHRHRLAPSVADRVAGLLDADRLTVLAGKMCGGSDGADGADVTWRPRGAAGEETLRVQRVVLCTGPQSDICRTGEPLLAKLVARGTLRPDPEHVGIDIDGNSRTRDAYGAINENIFTIGPMSRGAFWEIVAVPDIRRQVWDVARQLSNAHWVGGEGL